MESQIWHPPAGSVSLGRGVLWKGTMSSVTGGCLSVREKALPQLLPWCQPLQFLLVFHWCLSSCYSSAGWSSEGVSLNKSMCAFFKGNCLGLHKFLPLTQSPLFFSARSCGNWPSWHWNPGLGNLVWGWYSSLLRHPSQIFIHHIQMWDQPVLCCHRSYSLDGYGFFNSVLTRLPFNLIFGGSEWWLFCVLVVIWCGRERRWAVFTYATILTRSLKLFYTLDK